MTRHARCNVALAAGLVMAAALAGCSSNSDSAASSAGTASAVGGMTTCDDATITAAIEESLTADGEGGSLESLDELQCGDGWAAAEATIGDGSGEGVTETLVFQAEGQFWVPKDRGEACGSVTGDASVRPDDAEVPDSIWALACATN